MLFASDTKCRTQLKNVFAISRNYELDLALSKGIFINKASKTPIFFHDQGG